MRISSRITALKYKYLYNSLLYINRNNAETKRYQEEGLKLLSGKVDSLPSKIAFRPKFIKQSSCIKVFDKLYLFISKANIKKPVEERFDALFHEIGHWLHFQNIPPLKECREVWKNANLEKIKEDKFSLLDKIKELDPKQKVQFTLSIAISNEGEVDKDKFKSAQTAMDIVLGRGGDQAVVRQNDIYKFFGGRAQEVEKRTKVKARVVAHALENLIKESSKVMVMGHMNPDIDAMGSAIGIYRLAKSLDKNAYIIASNTASLQNFRESLTEEPEYEDVIISKEVAEENIDEDTLLVVVDTHKVNYVESEEVLKKASKIVIIDHHRRSADYIENATLTFQEVYASSAAELVTELLQYAEVNVELKKIEAEALYAGIMMDTKSFTFKTGVRTFEAAAYLRKCGVDIIRVKKWFQSDLESFNKIADIVRKAEIVNDSIAIALCDGEKSKDISLLCAKAADELLTISDVTASFVLGDTGEKVCISGRSIGDINVQVILEKLGGGGHITLAGAQVEGMTLEEVKQELIIRINEYFTEIEN